MFGSRHHFSGRQTARLSCDPWLAEPNTMARYLVTVLSQRLPNVSRGWAELGAACRVPRGNYGESIVGRAPLRGSTAEK